MKHVVIAIGLLACSRRPEPPSIDEAVAQHGAGAAPLIEAAEKIARAGLPTLREPGITVDGPPIALGYWSLGDEPPKTPTNITVIDENDLGDLTKDVYPDLELHSRQLVNVVSHCTALVKKKTMASSLVGARQAAKYLQACAHMRYLAVVRQRTVVKPTENKAAKTFSPGSFAGDVLVFGVASAKLLGGFVIELVQQREKVRAGEAASDFRRAVEG